MSWTSSRSFSRAKAMACVEVLGRSDGRGRVVRIRDEHHLRLGEDFRRHVVEVGKEPVLLGHGHPVREAADHDAAGVVDRIAGARHQRVLAGVYEGREEVGDALLASDERQDLCVGVKVHAEAAAHPLRACRAVARGARVAGIAVVGGVADGRRRGVDDVLGRGRVRVADAERDDVDALRLFGRPLAIDLGEQVRRKVGHALSGPHSSDILSRTTYRRITFRVYAHLLRRRRPPGAFRVMVADRSWPRR